MATPFKIINGIGLSREAWATVAAASTLAFETALGEDYGNLMEYRMVLDEMAAGGDRAAASRLRVIDARIRLAKAAGVAAANKLTAATIGRS